MKTSIKLVGFIYLFIYLFYMTLLSNHFYPFFFANYRVIVTTNFIVDTAAGYGLPPSQIIIIIIIIIILIIKMIMIIMMVY